MVVLLPALLAYKTFVVHMDVVAFIMSNSTLGYKYCIPWHKNVIEYVYVGNRRDKLKHVLCNLPHTGQIPEPVPSEG